MSKLDDYNATKRTCYEITSMFNNYGYPKTIRLTDEGILISYPNHRQFDNLSDEAKVYFKSALEEVVVGIALTAEIKRKLMAKQEGVRLNAQAELNEILKIGDK